MKSLFSLKYILLGLILPLVATLICEQKALNYFELISQHQMNPWIVLVPSWFFWLTTFVLVAHYLKKQHYKQRNFLGFFATMVILMMISLALMWKELLIWIMEK